MGIGKPIISPDLLKPNCRNHETRTASTTKRRSHHTAETKERAQSTSVLYDVLGNTVNAIYGGGGDACCWTICFRCSNMRSMLLIICCVVAP